MRDATSRALGARSLTAALDGGYSLVTSKGNVYNFCVWRHASKALNRVLLSDRAHDVGGGSPAEHAQDVRPILTIDAATAAGWPRRPIRQLLAITLADTVRVANPRTEPFSSCGGALEPAGRVESEQELLS